MDFPLPLTLVLMMEEDAAEATSATSTSARAESMSGIPRSSGVFSVVASEDRTPAQTSSQVA